MRLILALACAFVLAACAAPAGNPTETPTPEQRPVESTEPTPTPSFDLASVQPSREPTAGDELTGVLGADSIEGGCGYLQTDDGTRYQVIYPAGWDLALSPLQLTSPAGEVVARGGDEVTVRGTCVHGHGIDLPDWPDLPGHRGRHPLTRPARRADASRFTANAEISLTSSTGTNSVNAAPARRRPIPAMRSIPST